MDDTPFDDGSKQYNILVTKRKKLWESLFSRFKNVDQTNEGIALSDVGCKPTGFLSNDPTDQEECPADDLDTISDPNNEDFDDLSEGESEEDMAKFSDSEDDNIEILPRHVQQMISTYESDSEDELSEDLDETSNADERDFIDKYLNEMSNSRVVHFLGNNDDHSDDASDHSDDSLDNQIRHFNEMRRERIQLVNNEDVGVGVGVDVGDEDVSDDANDKENLEDDENQRKRKFSETEMADSSIESPPPIKKMNCQLKNVSIYINTSEFEFENDND